MTYLLGETITSVQFSQTDENLVAGMSNGTVSMLDIRTNESAILDFSSEVRILVTYIILCVLIQY